MSLYSYTAELLEKDGPQPPSQFSQVKISRCVHWKGFLPTDVSIVTIQAYYLHHTNGRGTPSLPSLGHFCTKRKPPSLHLLQVSTITQQRDTLQQDGRGCALLSCEVKKLYSQWFFSNFAKKNRNLHSSAFHLESAWERFIISKSYLEWGWVGQLIGKG